MYNRLKKTLSVIVITAFCFGTIPPAFSEQLELFTDSNVYTDGQPLFVYGEALPEENLIIRLFAPDGTIANFDQVIVTEDGSFNNIFLIWPESSTTFPYGTYTVEAISTSQDGLSKSVDVKFTSSSELVEIPIERRVNTMVFAPETGAINQPFRVFAQVSSDGLLVGGDPNKLLGTSHVHLPSDQVQSLSNSFHTLHQGLYFIDFTPAQTGTYVFHIVSFSQGTISHGSAATQVLTQDISGVAEQVIELNSILDETAQELDTLEEEIQGFGSTLESASGNIDKSVSSISSSVKNMEEASLQLNSLLFPIVALIGIIVALQIASFARRR